jgi:hypothetical protein
MPRAPQAPRPTRAGLKPATGRYAHEEFHRFPPPAAAGIAAAAAALSVTPVAQAAQVARAGPPPPVVPGDIQVPAGN